MNQKGWVREAEYDFFGLNIKRDVKQRGPKGGEMCTVKGITPDDGYVLLDEYPELGAKGTPFLFNASYFEGQLTDDQLIELLNDIITH